VELDAALGGRAVQYRELQGNETEKFLSLFRPCIMPQPGGVASGFNHVEINEQEHLTRLYICSGKHVVHVKEASYQNHTICVHLFVLAVARFLILFPVNTGPFCSFIP
jgi:gelsolin